MPECFLASRKAEKKGERGRGNRKVEVKWIQCTQKLTPCHACTSTLSQKTYSMKQRKLTQQLRKLLQDSRELTLKAVRKKN